MRIDRSLTAHWIFFHRYPTLKDVVSTATELSSSWASRSSKSRTKFQNGEIISLFRIQSDVSRRERKETQSRLCIKRTRLCSLSPLATSSVPINRGFSSKGVKGTWPKGIHYFLQSSLDDRAPILFPFPPFSVPPLPLDIARSGRVRLFNTIVVYSHALRIQKSELR